MPGAQPEVLLVDDQLGVRRGIEMMLTAAGFRIVGHADTGEQAHALLRRRRLDVALVGTSLDEASTTPLLAELLAERPGAPVVIYAGRDRPALSAAAALGAPGLVLRASPPDTLFHALGEVAAGRRFVDPLAARRLTERPRRPVRAGVARLSPREREILGLLAEGLSGAQIAGRLFLSTETVRTHVRNAVQKLDARTRTHAVAMLVTDGSWPVPAGSRDESMRTSQPQRAPAGL